jgi:hypothetical protein
MIPKKHVPGLDPGMGSGILEKHALGLDPQGSCSNEKTKAG